MFLLVKPSSLSQCQPPQLVLFRLQLQLLPRLLCLVLLLPLLLHLPLHHPLASWYLMRHIPARRVPLSFPKIPHIYTLSSMDRKIRSPDKILPEILEKAPTQVQPLSLQLRNPIISRLQNLWGRRNTLRKRTRMSTLMLMPMWWILSPTWMSMAMLMLMPTETNLLPSDHD